MAIKLSNSIRSLYNVNFCGVLHHACRQVVGNVFRGQNTDFGRGLPRPGYVPSRVRNYTREGGRPQLSPISLGFKKLYANTDSNYIWFSG